MSDRWAECRAALKVLHDIEASRGCKVPEILKALHSVDVRNAIADAVYVMRSGPADPLDEVEARR
jgi:hypothetical protein